MISEPDYTKNTKEPCPICGVPEITWHQATRDKPIPAKTQLAQAPTYPFFLKKCEECGQLWLEQHYEPWGSYQHSVTWPGTIKEALLAFESSDLSSLYHWHSQQVRRATENLNIPAQNLGMLSKYETTIEFDQLFI